MTDFLSRRKPNPPSDFLSHLNVLAISDLQDACHYGSRAKGFHEEGDRLRAPFDQGEWDQGDVSALRNHYANKLMLIVGEVAEAHEELRSGHAMDETYYPTLRSHVISSASPELHKPEGVPSELADVVIRVFDLAEEAGIDLASMIVEKLTYNATRPHKHGGKKF